MIVLQIEHPVQSFEEWKKVFETDPIDRKKSGVRRYRIFRPINHSTHVIVDLEFENLELAENALAALQKVWGQVEGKVIMGPKTRLLQIEEAKDL
jgi:hypothetical protein